MKLHDLSDYSFLESINSQEWEYDLMVGPKTMGTRTLMPIVNITVDHDNKMLVFEHEPAEGENGD
jgi:hypothetical protein